MTIYISNTHTYFETNPKTGKMWKCAEWELVSDSEMVYTKFNENGTINRKDRFTEKNMLEIWNRYHTKQQYGG